MFQKIFRKESSPKVYLGEFYVNSRSSIKEFFEMDSGSNSAADIEHWLTEFLGMPKYHSVLNEEVLLLDLAVLKYQKGTDFGTLAQPLIPILWRPGVKMKARLREPKTGKVVGEYSTKKYMPWSQFLLKLISFRSNFTGHDLYKYLCLSLIDCVRWANNAKNS